MAGLLLAVAAASGIAEHRRRKRTDLNAVGWMPWMLIQFAALFSALIAVSLALHGAG
ncbi:hypothetical protein ACFQ1E_10060 [Sphingomonas canadensis]|uniref:HIG1 domain-containing protein n=1 Tax=Sphingomonas canadensis TaxID=1219257 RepID=A0ABW3H7A6_9SPHN|nr:hypothetical protein [Sphingomonas canadensis]